MKYAAQYLRSATSIIEQYDGTMPLAAFLKQYFKSNTKSGSKDRRYISQLCYTYYRTGHSIIATTVEEKIRASIFLCGLSMHEWQEIFSEEWLSKWEEGMEAKWKFIGTLFPGSDPGKLFPWKDELSKEIEPRLFADSHLIQPDLFLRIRPGKEKIVLQKLAEHNIAYDLLPGNCVSLPNGTKIDAILLIDKEVVIQDRSSQRAAEFFPDELCSSKSTVRVWDCCAASGGKSLLLCDHIQNISLAVSDVRPSILRNLKERFAEAGIRNYDSFIADLSTKFKMDPAIATKFKLVVCDAPCSGSGTWGRTPEQLYFFGKEKIETYADLQKKILTNVMTHLEKEGYLLYITCSVFAEENEEAVAFIQNNSDLTLIKMELLKGYDQKADTMFAALFQLRE